MTKRQKAENAVVRAAMRLYRRWVEFAKHSTLPHDWCETGHWYPLGSKDEAIPFGKACARLAKMRGKM